MEPIIRPPLNRTRRAFFIFSIAGIGCLADNTPGTCDDLFAIRKARRRVAPLCSVPPADYQYQARSPSLVVRSLPAIEKISTDAVERTIEVLREYSESLSRLDATKDSAAEPSAGRILAISQAKLERRLAMQEMLADARRPTAKLMQLATREMTIVHCRISDVALQIERSGIWQLSLRGDQNYLRENQTRERNVDLQIKRNAFHIKIRLLRSSHSGGESLTPAVANQAGVDQGGKLTLAEIHVPKIWVQREAPQFVTHTGYHPMISAHYDDMDQAEFEFFVQLDPLTGAGKGVVAPWQNDP